MSGFYNIFKTGFDKAISSMPKKIPKKIGLNEAKDAEEEIVEQQENRFLTSLDTYLRADGAIRGMKALEDLISEYSTKYYTSPINLNPSAVRTMPATPFLKAYLTLILSSCVMISIQTVVEKTIHNSPQFENLKKTIQGKTNENLETLNEYNSAFSKQNAIEKTLNSLQLASFEKKINHFEQFVIEKFKSQSNVDSIMQAIESNNIFTVTRQILMNDEDIGQVFNDQGFKSLAAYLDIVTEPKFLEKQAEINLPPETLKAPTGFQLIAQDYILDERLKKAIEAPTIEVVLDEVKKEIQDEVKKETKGKDKVEYNHLTDSSLSDDESEMSDKENVPNIIKGPR